MLIERVFLWSGGGAFVASLGLTAYKFALDWSAAAPRTTGSMAAAIVVNAFLFTVFALHHSVLARGRMKTWFAKMVPVRLLRSVYVWTASVLLGAMLLWWQPIGHEIYHVSGWLALGLYAVQGAGLLLIIRAARIIDALELAGIRAGARAGLVIRGPYRLVRHPLYLGWLLVVWGPPLMTGDRLTFAVVSSAYLLLAMPWEEASMERTLGSEYARYRSIVRWRLIPGVY